MTVPEKQRIYHITHVDNLDEIVREGALRSDAVMAARGGPAASIGMSAIKLRRLTELYVKCYPGDFVGEYVPFFFCPRSIMLYLFHMDNKPELTYHGGQGPIVHLEADLRASIAWAEADGRRWAFSRSNAGARYTEFRNDPDQLSEVDWAAVANDDFRSSTVKEGKQAEFLMQDLFPWDLIRRIGVHSETIKTQVEGILAEADHQPPVVVRQGWYF